VLPEVGKKIASRAAGKKTTVDRTILPWTVKEEEEEEEKRFGSWGRKLWLETMWSPHDQTTFATTFVSMDCSCSLVPPRFQISLSGQQAHTEHHHHHHHLHTSKQNTHECNPQQQGEEERNQMVVLMAAHGIEMGFFLNFLSNPGARFLQNPFEHSFSLTKLR